MNATLEQVFEAFHIGDAAQQRSIIDLLQRSGVPLGAEFTPSPEQPKPALVMLDPANIKVDAATYQFRFNGDNNGVTRKGRYDTNRWDPILHGDPLLVHERLDGSFYVADGHHRLDLAKRLNAAGNGPGMVTAMVLREADGYSPHDVKIIAAYKNIAHGQTDPVETALVFKESTEVDPARLPELQDKGTIPTARALSQLSEPALRRVVQDQIPAEVAAQVPGLTADPKQQDSVMRRIGEKLRNGYAEAVRQRSSKGDTQLTR